MIRRKFSASFASSTQRGEPGRMRLCPTNEFRGLRCRARQMTSTAVLLAARGCLVALRALMGEVRNQKITSLSLLGAAVFSVRREGSCLARFEPQLGVGEMLWTTRRLLTAWWQAAYQSVACARARDRGPRPEPCPRRADRILPRSRVWDKCLWGRRCVAGSCVFWVSVAFPRQRYVLAHVEYMRPVEACHGTGGASGVEQKPSPALWRCETAPLADVTDSMDVYKQVNRLTELQASRRTTR